MPQCLDTNRTPQESQTTLRRLIAITIAVFLHVPLVWAYPGLLVDDLQSCDPKVALDAAREIVKDPDSLKEPLLLFKPAWVLFEQGKKHEAVFWFYAAQLRTRYQLVFEKGDHGQLMSIMLMTMGEPINNHALQDIPRFLRTLDRVLEWDRDTPNPYRGRNKSEKEEKQIELIYTGLREMKTKLSAERGQLQRQARAASHEVARKYSRTTPCVQTEVDPARRATRTIERERPTVISYVTAHQGVQREAGTIVRAYVASSRTKGGIQLPHRYIAAVVGSEKLVYAVVDVVRSSAAPTFTLACVTEAPSDQDPSEDDCKQ